MPPAGSHPVESLPGEQSLTLFERLEESGHFNKRLFEGAYVEPREAGPKRVFELAGIGWFELGGNPAGEILIQKFCRLGVVAPKGFLLCVSEQRVDVGLLGHADNDAVHRTAR